MQLVYWQKTYLPGKLWVKGAMNGKYLYQISKHILKLKSVILPLNCQWNKTESLEIYCLNMYRYKHLKWVRRKLIIWSVMLDQHRSHLLKIKLDPTSYLDKFQMLKNNNKVGKGNNKGISNFIMGKTYPIDMSQKSTKKRSNRFYHGKLK